MSLGVAGILSAVCDHARTLGQFAAVLAYEPKAAPDPRGVTLAVWGGSMDPIAASGLASTSVRVELTARGYRNMLIEPQDDTVLLGAMDALVAGLSGDFDLGGQLRNVDLLGAHGAPLAWTMGYVQQDNKLYRIADLTIPLIVNDLWGQVQ